MKFVSFPRGHGVAMPNNKYPKDLQITVVKLANGKRLGSRPRLVEICHRVAAQAAGHNFDEIVSKRFKRFLPARFVDTLILIMVTSRDNLNLCEKIF